MCDPSYSRKLNEQVSCTSLVSSVQLKVKAMDAQIEIDKRTIRQLKTEIVKRERELSKLTGIKKR